MSWIVLTCLYSVKCTRCSVDVLIMFWFHRKDTEGPPECTSGKLSQQTVCRECGQHLYVVCVCSTSCCLCSGRQPENMSRDKDEAGTLTDSVSCYIITVKHVIIIFYSASVDLVFYLLFKVFCYNVRGYLITNTIHFLCH